jgi:hypothetical protein
MHGDTPDGIGGINSLHFLWLWFAAPRGGARRHCYARAGERCSWWKGDPRGSGRWASGCLDRAADEQSQGGNVFGYADERTPHRLLDMPLAPEIPNLSAA